MRILRFPLSLCCLLLLTTACAAPKERFFWPLPPEEPKVEFIGVYASSIDLQGKVGGALFGDATDPLRQPSGVAADGQGKVYVADGVKNRVMVFDFVKGKASDYDHEFKLPFGLALDSKKNLYVVERGNTEVRVFNSNQEPLFRFGKDQLKMPIAIAIDEEHGRIYVSDRKDSSVKVFTLTGEFIQSISGDGTGVEGNLYRPYGLAIDRSGNLYVADQLNARIQVFDPSGTFVRRFGVRGDQMTNFESPMGMAFDSAGLLWIVDVRKSAVLTYDVSGAEPKLLFATHGPAPEKGNYSFVAPTDIAIDQGNRIYVVDALARRISVLQYLTPPYLAQRPLPANWMQRTDLMDLWYRDSGLTPPVPDKQAAPPKP